MFSNLKEQEKQPESLWRKQISDLVPHSSIRQVCGGAQEHAGKMFPWRFLYTRVSEPPSYGVTWAPTALVSNFFFTTNHSMKFYIVTQDTVKMTENKSLMK